MRVALAVMIAAFVATRSGSSAADPDAPAPAPAPGLEARMAKLEAELAELRAANDAELAAGNDADKEPAFRVYGFIDMGLEKLWAQDDIALPTTKTTFVLGNINLYFDFHPAAEWSSLIEARLTNAPSDAEQPGIPQFGLPYSRFNTAAPDTANGDGYDSLHWGALVLERAYIQWQRWAQLGVRVGQFLTPYGIWNVDHGTPTLIALYRPKAQSNEMFPEHQLGVEAFGRFDVRERWQLEWHGYVSNGRTPGTVALTENKMFGGRAVMSTTRPYAMAFGVSAMTGSYLNAQHNADPVTAMVERPITVHYNEWAVGVDASLDLGPLRLRGEGAVRHKDYTNGERDLWYPGIYVADGYELDGYALAAYRIPHTRFEPYVYGEYYYWPTPVGDKMLNTSIGLNTYFTPSISLKLQLAGVDWLETSPVIGKTNADEVFLAAKLVMGF
jgi:hypothetical protein